MKVSDISCFSNKKFNRLHFVTVKNNIAKMTRYLSEI